MTLKEHPFGQYKKTTFKFNICKIFRFGSRRGLVGSVMAY